MSLEGGGTTTETARRPVSRELPENRAWSVEEVAYFLCVSDSLVRKLEQGGRLQALPRISRRLTFDPQQVKAFRAGVKPRGNTR
jgi:hypothetical protein